RGCASKAQSQCGPSTSPRFQAAARERAGRARGRATGPHHQRARQSHFRANRSQERQTERPSGRDILATTKPVTMEPSVRKSKAADKAKTQPADSTRKSKKN